MPEEYIALSKVIRRAGPKIDRADILEKLKNGELPAVAYLGGNPNDIVSVEPGAWHKIKPRHLATSRTVKGTRVREHIYLNLGILVEERIRLLRDLLQAAKAENRVQVVAADPGNWFLAGKTLPGDGDTEGWRDFHAALVERLATTVGYKRKAPIYVTLPDYKLLLNDLDIIAKAKGGRPPKQGNDLFWLMVVNGISRQIPKEFRHNINPDPIASHIEKLQSSRGLQFDDRGKKPLSYQIIFGKVKKAIDSFESTS